MAKIIWQETVNNSELQIKQDGNLHIKANDTARLADITAIQALSDITRQFIVDECADYPTLDDYDDHLEAEEWILRDRLDYYDYPDSTVNLTAKEGAWFSPDIISSFCGEDVADPAVDSINGVNSDFWRHSTNHQHIIVYQLRTYPKKISKIRFRYGSSESARERLNNMDVHASRGLNGIDKPPNILETGINIAWPTGQGSVWVEHTLAKKKNNARYIKLVIDDTDNANNQIQIREFEVFVETLDSTDSF